MTLAPVSDLNHIVRRRLGKRIRRARKEKHFTQVILASLCNLHVSHLSKIERGQANATLSTMVLIGQALGISLADLFRDVASEDGAASLPSIEVL